MTTELDRIITQGFYNKDATSKEVIKDYRWYCRQNDRPCIYLYSPQPGRFALLIGIDSLREGITPTRATKTKVAKLRRTWETRLGYKKDCLDLNAYDARVSSLTETEAHELAAALWAIVGQPNAYEYSEPEDDEESEEDES